MKSTLKILCFFLLFSLLFTSCKSKKSVTPKERTQRVVVKNTAKKPKDVTPVVTKPKVDKPAVVTPKKPTGTYADVVANYISTYSTIAKQEMASYGIPASITLAQGILESGAGRGELTSKANNHFGIKCHTSWTGERVYHDDDELQECFRKYEDPANSFRDHSLFLTGRSRYAFLFNLDSLDYKGWAKGLRKAGYATDPKYPDKLIRIIERYNLAAYDSQVIKLTNGASLTTNTSGSSTRLHVVTQGDTLYAISKKYNVSVENLRRLNGLNSNDISIGQTLYLQPQ